MRLTDLAAAVDAILGQAASGDDELAHAMEDRLLGALVAEYAPLDVTKEMVRLEDGDFGAWYEEWYVKCERGETP